jgi:hypothetical protein
MVQSPPAAVRKSPRTIRNEAIERRSRAINERNRAIDERNGAIAAAEKVKARRKLNDKQSGKLKKKPKIVSKEPESFNTVELASTTKNVKRKQSSGAEGGVTKTVKTRRLSDIEPSPAEAPYAQKKRGIDSEGPPSTSGTGKVAKPVRKKTSSQVARVLQARQRKESDHSELDDSEQESIDNSYAVDTASDNHDSGVHESSSEEEEVAVEDDESESSSQERRADAIFERSCREIHDNREEVSTSAGHKTGAVLLSRHSTEVVQAPTNEASSLLLQLDGPIRIRGMSRTESMRNRQKHVAERVRTFVKTDVFRRIKFINSDTMFEQAIKLVMDHENIPEQQRDQFQMLYESVFNEALNTKRSSCEQSGGKIVKESIAKFAESGEDFFTVDELSTLRRAKTDRERKAFFWFFGTFLECVCGRRNWGKQKHYELISKATEKGGRGKIVTRSDEAFALLMFDNYIDKWTNPIAVTDQDAAGTNEQGKRKQPRQRGKYTAKKSGHCKYGGWSREGTKQFNQFYKLVQEDRTCPQADAMEKELMAFCRKSQKGGRDHDGGDKQQQDEGNTAESDVIEASLVEAAWDLDDS